MLPPIPIDPEPQYLVLQAARERQTTKLLRQAYVRRAGNQATIARSIRSDRLRRIRHIGLARVHLAHLLITVEVQ